MSNTVFKKWTDAVRHLNKKIKNNRLIAGQNIQLEDTGHGIRINCNYDSPPADSYNGMFKMIQTATDKIKIINGIDEESANCGIVQVNKLSSQAIPVTELTIAADCYIYRKAVAVMSGDPETMTSADVTFEQSAYFPEWEAGMEKEVLGEVKFANGKIADFWYLPLPSRISIRGAC